jgi:hypothetical protein
MMIPGWTTLATAPAVLVREYGFGAGRANALAVALPDRRWMIVSPPPRMSPEEISAFDAHGEVIALVSNNGSHHLGLGPCRGYFPKAVTYAAPASAERIRKKGKDFGQLEAIAELAPLLGADVSLLEVDGCKIGDVLVRVRSDEGVVLYASDFIANIQQLPKNVLIRTFFKLTDSGPGLKVFRAFLMFFVKDRRAAIDFLLRELHASPPAILVPAHGDVIARPDLGTTLTGMLQAAR